jgi:hypothetical protein
MKIQVVGIDRLKLYREKKDSNEPDPPIVEPPRQESLEYPDDEFLLDWEDGAEGVEDPDMPYYLGGGGGVGQPPPPPPPPPGPQGGGGGVPAHAPVVGRAGQGELPLGGRHHQYRVNWMTLSNIGAIGIAGLQNQNKRFWVPIAIEFFRTGRLRFFRKNS